MAGFNEIGESLEETVRREVMEETVATDGTVEVRNASIARGLKRK